MRSADVLRADEAVEFFSKCLREHGLEDAVVNHYTEDFTDVLYIQKNLGEEQLAARVSIDFRQYTTEDIATIQKRLAMQAERVAEQFHEEMVMTFEWDGRTVDVSMYNGGWAKCHNCGTRINFDRRTSTPFTEDAELSCPHPLPRDTERTVANLSGEEEILFRLYVLGQLREQCDRNCRNYKYSYQEGQPAVLDGIASD